MALTSTMYTFDIALSDVDRNVYEQLNLKVACHPSETEEYLLTRLLAYCLEYTEGIAFSRGLGDPDEPAISVRDLTGVLKAWIEVGSPDAARLHKASKASPRVAIYTHKEPRLLLRAYEGEKIHRAERVELYAVDRDLLAELVSHLDRRVAMTLSVSDRHLFIDIGGTSVSGTVERHALA
ncbi:MAG: YaeQ family protein [Gemmatimonadota bacterium]